MIRFVLIFFFGTIYSSAQTLFSVDYKSQSDINVFVVDYKSQADLLVYKVDYKSQAKGNEGLWHFVDHKSQADFAIYLASDESTFTTGNTFSVDGGMTI